jgi:hypothetical protein
LRALQPQAEEALTESGKAGSYLQLFDSEQKRLSSIRTLWVPDIDLSQALTKLRTSSILLGLARDGKRIGFNVKQAHFDDAWAALRPGTKTPIDLSGTQEFVLQSLPPGCNVVTAQSFLDKIGWAATAVNPKGKEGFVVPSSTPPPNEGVLFLDGANLIATPVQAKLKAFSQKVVVAGSFKWSTQIPPSAQHSSSSQSAPVPGPVTSCLDQRVGELETRLMAELSSQVQSFPHHFVRFFRGSELFRNLLLGFLSQNVRRPQQFGVRHWELPLLLTVAINLLHWLHLFLMQLQVGFKT